MNYLSSINLLPTGIALNDTAQLLGFTKIGPVDFVTRSVERVEKLRESDSFFVRQIGSRLALLPVGTSLAIHSLANGIFGSVFMVGPSLLYAYGKNQPRSLQVLGLFASLPQISGALQRYERVVKDSVSKLLLPIGLLVPEYAMNVVRKNGSAAAKKPQPTRLESIRQAVQNGWQHSSLKVKTVLGYGPKPEGMCKRAYKSVISLTSDNSDILAGAALVSAMCALAYSRPDLSLPRGSDFVFRYLG